ncbi:restriction endonuclease subunit S [Bacillus coagulans]|nr:restriction endonuclease subunit S [Heyndrickxia coagulans]MBF8417037.1 restriction endonuclease subunit S [Heyndrickxia coagulans]
MEELLEEALVPEEEQPYEVPGNWVWVKLKTINKDKKRNIDPKNFKDETFELYSVPSFPEGSPEFIKGDEIGSSKQLVNKDEILLCKINPRINRVWKVLNNHGKFRQLASTEWIVISENKAIYSEYLLYLLKSPYFRKLITSNVSGVGGSLTRARPKEVETYPIAVPPIKEQKRIADKVERLLSKIDEAKRLIEEAKETFELRRAAILDKAFQGELTRKWREQHPEIESAEVLYNKIIRFTKPKNVSSNVEQKLNIPDTWKMVRLGEVVQVNPPKKKLEEISDQQICTFVPMPAVSDKTGKIESPEEKEYAKVKKGYTFFLENDVLFAKITPCMENGKSAIAKNLKNGFGFGSTEFHVLRTNEYINERYLHYLVRSKKFRLEAKGEMTGAVGQQRVPKEFLVNYPFPLPPKEEQDAIVDILDEIFTRDDIAYRIIETKYELETLKQSILSKAFRGELGTNDPTEESAIELLKEVLQEQVI